MFNQEAAEWVEATIAKSDNPELLALMVVADVLHEDIAKNQRVVGGLVVDIHKSMFDGIEKMHRRGAISDDDLENISKAFHFEISNWDRENPNRRGEGGRFAPGGQGTWRPGMAAGAVGENVVAGLGGVKGVSRNFGTPDKPREGLDVVASLARSNPDEFNPQFAQKWTEAAKKPHGTNARTFARIEGGSKVLSALGTATGMPALTAAGKAGEYAGKFGPEAEKVFGPSIRRAMYRYRGVERKPEQKLLNLESEIAEYNGHQAAAAKTRGQEWKNVTASGAEAAKTYLSQKLPEMRLSELQRTSGRVTPSEGVIIDASGKITNQAFGHADDHYLPFNLTNLKNLKGGEYVRTRTAGGLTAEDIYTGLMAGAKRMTVLSNAGEFTLEFADDLRGARRHGSIARTMTERYKRTLDAIQNENLSRESIPTDVKAELRARVEQDMPRSLHSPQDIDAAYKSALEEYQQSDSLTQGEMAALDRKAQADLATKKMQQGTPEYDKALQQMRVVLQEQAVENKKSRRHQLNGDGYATALEALREQYPYFIKDVSFKTRNEKTTKIPDGVKEGQSRAIRGDELTVYRNTNPSARKLTNTTDHGFVNANEERPSHVKTLYSFDRTKNNETPENAAPKADAKKPAATAPTGPNSAARSQKSAQAASQAKISAIVQKLPMGTIDNIISVMRSEGENNPLPTLAALSKLPSSDLPYETAALAANPEAVGALVAELEQVDRKINNGKFEDVRAGLEKLRNGILAAIPPSKPFDPKRVGEVMDFSGAGAGYQLGDGAERHNAAKAALAPKIEPLMQLAGGDRTLAVQIAREAANPNATTVAAAPAELAMGIEAALTRNRDTVLASAKALAQADYLDHLIGMEGGGAGPKAPTIPASRGEAVSAPAAPSTPAKTQPSSPGSPAPSERPASKDTFDKIYDEFAAHTVGQEPLKESLKEFNSFMKWRTAHQEAGYEVEPMDAPTFVLSGPPGTGKTTSAKALGKMLHAAGVIENPEPHFELAGDLTGTHVGDAAKLTADAVKAAHGKVLVIDEAHALLHNDYGKSVMSALVGAIQPGSKTAVVLAGYPKQMDKVVSLDPGMKRRVTKQFDLQAFTGPELAQITQQMLSDPKVVGAKDAPLTLSDDGRKALGEILLASKKKDGEAFGNAGTIKQLLQDALRRHSHRVNGDISDRVLTAEDFRPKLTVKRANTLTQKTLPDATNVAENGNLKKPVSKSARRYLKIGAGVAGGVGAGAYAANMAQSIGAERKYRDPATARAKAEDMNSEANRKVTTRGKMNLVHGRTDPVKRAVRSYTNSFDSVKNFDKDTSDSPNKARAVLPKYHQNKALGHVLDNAPRNQRRLYRGMAVTPDVKNNLKDATGQPKRVQSFTHGKDTAEAFADGVSTGLGDRPSERSRRVVMTAPKKQVHALYTAGSKYPIQREWLVKDKLKYTRKAEDREGTLRIGVRSDR